MTNIEEYLPDLFSRKITVEKVAKLTKKTVDEVEASLLEAMTLIAQGQHEEIVSRMSLTTQNELAVKQFKLRSKMFNIIEDSIDNIEQISKAQKQTLFDMQEQYEQNDEACVDDILAKRVTFLNIEKKKHDLIRSLFGIEKKKGTLIEFTQNLGGSSDSLHTNTPTKDDVKKIPQKQKEIVVDVEDVFSADVVEDVLDDIQEN